MVDRTLSSGLDASQLSDEQKQLLLSGTPPHLLGLAESQKLRKTTPETPTDLEQAQRISDLTPILGEGTARFAASMRLAARQRAHDEARQSQEPTEMVDPIVDVVEAIGDGLAKRMKK